jgi:MFS family permease
MIWSPILPSVVNQLAPEHLRGRYNVASTIAWQISLIAGPVFAGTLFGLNAYWCWLASLIVGLLFVYALALKLNNVERNQEL